MEKQWFYDEYLEDKMLIIANNMFGDYILIGIGEENYGMVYFRYHDRKKKYIKLNDSFKEFVDICRSQEKGYVESIFERIVGLYENSRADNITDITIQCWQDDIDYWEDIHQEEVILTKEFTPRFIKEKDNLKDNIETLNYEELIERMNNEKSNNKKLSCLLRLCNDYTNKENIEQIYQLGIENALKTEPYPGYVYFDILNIAYKKDTNLFRRIKISNQIRIILRNYLKNEIVFSDEYKYKKKNDSLSFYSEESMRLKIKKVIDKY